MEKIIPSSFPLFLLYLYFLFPRDLFPFVSFIHPILIPLLLSSFSFTLTQFPRQCSSVPLSLNLLLISLRYSFPPLTFSRIIVTPPPSFLLFLHIKTVPLMGCMEHSVHSLV
jgi:hypothetical protein